MARVKRVNKCRKPQGKCGRCGVEINKGDPYIHWSPGFRGRKRKRCTSPACYPRSSELTANDRLSRCYAAQESVEDQLQAWDREDVEVLRSALEEAAQEIREVGEEYQESADAINETAEGSPIAEECQEKAENLESWADEIESTDLEEFDPDSFQCEACEGEGQAEIDMDQGERKVDCPDCDGTGKNPDYEAERDAWAQQVIDAVEGVMGDCPI